MKRNNNIKCRDLGRGETIILFCSIIAVIMMCFIFCGSIITQAAPKKNVCKYYTSIQIKAGDTLWEIANEYITDEYPDINKYMQEVCAINHISEDTIHAGQYIVVPYYSAESEELIDR